MGGACGSQGQSPKADGFTGATPGSGSHQNFPIDGGGAGFTSQPGAGTGNGSSLETVIQVDDTAAKAMNPIVRASLNEFLSVCNQSPEDSIAIAKAARMLSGVTAAVGEARDEAEKRLNFLHTNEADMHQLVCSRRNTVVTKPVQAIPEDRTQFLKGEIGKWDADIVSMSGDEKVIYLEMIYDHFGLIDTFQIPRGCLRIFLLTVRSLYHEENPYHNFIHATDVASTCTHLYKQTSVSETLTDLDLLALLTGTIMHDVDHPGVNQAFEKVLPGTEQPASVYCMCPSILPSSTDLLCLAVRLHPGISCALPPWTHVSIQPS